MGIIKINKVNKTNKEMIPYAQFFKNNLLTMLIVDEQSGKILNANLAALNFYGYKKEELLSKHTWEINNLGREKSLEWLQGHRFQEMKLLRYKHRLANGEIRDVELYTSKVKTGSRPVLYSIVIDITDRVKAEAQISHMAYHDTMTGLSNRYSLREYINQELILDQKIENFAILFIDLDRFRLINDSFGHSFGDLVLIEVSKRLKAIFPASKSVFSYRGDQFVILVKSPLKAEVIKSAEEIIRRFSDPLKVKNREVFISPSIGISIFPRDGGDKETLIKNADMAAQLAKEKGKNTYQFFTTDFGKKTSRKLDLENCLRRAVQNNEFMVCYQPQVNLCNRKIVGVEALIRWKHPELGLISPAEFIPLAEETGLIVPIGKWVLETVCKQVIAWQTEIIPLSRVAINVSGRQLQGDNFIEDLKNIIKETSLKPEHLEIEITESIMHNADELESTLKDLKKIGVRISIDDFGTGYSSLSLLKHLPIDTLKIDQSFIKDLVIDSKATALVETIISMGHSLNFEVVAEGVETEEQFSFLQRKNCNLGQGYLFSKPVDTEEIVKFISAYSKGD